MSVGYILGVGGNKMGLNPSVESERVVMLRWLNEAALEIYQQADVNGVLVEQLFKINGHQTIAMPSSVGPVRGMREYNSQIPWHLNQMRPRYNVANWKDMWRNFRLKGTKALTRAITNQSRVILTVAEVENPPVVVSVTGPTDNSSRITEVITMDATSKTSLNNFNDIDSVTKVSQNEFDIYVKDVDGNTLTVLPNNELQCEYQIINVSTLPWLNVSQSQQDHYVEVLYKKKLPYLSKDGDEFVAQGYDYIIINKMLQLWAEEQEKVDVALAYDSKVTRGMARKNEDENRATEDTVAFVPNPHDQLLVKIRVNKPSRLCLCRLSHSKLFLLIYHLC